MQFASFGVSFRALSGASRDASEEVSFSAPTDVWNGAQAPRKATWSLASHKCRVTTREKMGQKV